MENKKELVRIYIQTVNKLIDEIEAGNLSVREINALKLKTISMKQNLTKKFV